MLCLNVGNSVGTRNSSSTHFPSRGIFLKSDHQSLGKSYGLWNSIPKINYWKILEILYICILYIPSSLKGTVSDEVIVPNTYSWSSLYRQKVVPEHYTGICSIIHIRGHLNIARCSCCSVIQNTATDGSRNFEDVGVWKKNAVGVAAKRIW